MKAAFLVDGLTEKRFVQTVCPKASVKMIGLNGNTVSNEALAQKICSIIRTMKGRSYPVIIIVDKEDRQIETRQFQSELLLLIKKEVNEEIILGVADRMIENWMLAGIETIKSESVDGKHGTNELKKIKPNYKKSTHGPDILKNCKPSVMKEKSNSFSDFFELISTIDCHWIRR